MDQIKLTIDPGLKNLIAPLRPEEFEQLKANLLAEGCRDPIAAWPCDDGTLIILDGHNRHAICCEHGIDYRIHEIELETYEDAEDWIDRNQLGRRNLSPDQASFIRGRRFLRAKKREGGTGSNQYKQLPQNEGVPGETAERLAKEHGVSRATVERDGRFASAVEKVKSIDPEIELKVASGNAPPKSLIVEVVKEITEAEQDLQKVKTEFYNNSYISDPPRNVKEAAALLETKKEKAAEILAGKKTVKEIKAEIKREKKMTIAAQINSEPTPLPLGPFRVLVVDPPWSYRNRADDPTHRAANPYPSMTVEQICALPVASIAHEDCILWLWTTNAHTSEAFEVLDAWGFEYKTTLTWFKDRMGTGDWLRGQTEHCLMAIRGKPTVLLTNQTTALYGSLREHSRKPESFYELVDSLCPGSKVDLFSRENRAGWASWGGELEKFFKSFL